jgi:hypothetical protein
MGFAHVPLAQKERAPRPALQKSILEVFDLSIQQAG